MTKETKAYVGKAAAGKPGDVDCASAIQHRTMKNKVTVIKGPFGGLQRQGRQWTMRAGNEAMPEDTIQLHPDKVCLRITVAGRSINDHAVALSEKTIYRIKKARTRLATAHRLAAILGTTVEDLLLPSGRDEVERQLPAQLAVRRRRAIRGTGPPFPAHLAIGGGRQAGKKTFANTATMLVTERPVLPSLRR